MDLPEGRVLVMTMTMPYFIIRNKTLLLCLKWKVFNQYVLPAMTYRLPDWYKNCTEKHRKDCNRKNKERQEHDKLDTDLHKTRLYHLQSKESEMNMAVHLVRWQKSWRLERRPRDMKRHIDNLLQIGGVVWLCTVISKLIKSCSDRKSLEDVWGRSYLTVCE